MSKSVVSCTRVSIEADRGNIDFMLYYDLPSYMVGA